MTPIIVKPITTIAFVLNNIMKLTLPNGSSKRGAQMGRVNQLPNNIKAPVKLRLTRLRWVSGDYDQFGAYWGGGSNDYVFCAWGQWGIPFKDVFVFVRATDREDAKEKVKLSLPNAKFYR